MENTQKDIIIKLRADASRLKSEFKQAALNIKTNIALIQRQIDSINFTKAGTLRRRFTAGQKKDLEMLGVSQKKLRTQLQGITSDYNNKDFAIKKTIESTREQIKNTSKSTKSVGNLRGMLLGAGLSALFFGMAMRNAALNVWKTGTKAFQEVMHSVEGTVTQFDLLSGSMQYLKFTVGQALEPLAAKLFPIVDRLSEWVSKNPGLARSAVIFGVILGTFFLLAGQIGTFLVGMSGLKTAIASTNTEVKALDASSKSLSVTWGTMSTAGKIGFVGVIAGIMLAVSWIFKLKEAIGGWGEFFKSVIRGVLRVVSFLGDFLIRGIITPLQTMVALAVRAFDFLGMDSPSWMTKFVYWQPPDLTSQYMEFEKNKLAPEKGYGEVGGTTPNFYIDTLNVTSDNVDDILSQIQANTQ